MRADLVLDLIRTRNVVAAAVLLGLLIASRVFVSARKAWFVLLFGILAVALGYALKRFGG